MCVCVFGGRLRAWPELIKAGCDMRNTLRPTFHSHFDASDRVMFTQETALSHIPTHLSSHVPWTVSTQMHTHTSIIVLHVMFYTPRLKDCYLHGKILVESPVVYKQLFKLAVMKFFAGLPDVRGL